MNNRMGYVLAVTTLQGRRVHVGIGAHDYAGAAKPPTGLAKRTQQDDASADTGEKNHNFLASLQLYIPKCRFERNKAKLCFYYPLLVHRIVKSDS